MFEIHFFSNLDEPNIITKLRTMNIPRHEDPFNITCIAEAIPLPVVEWTSPSYITNLSRPITEVFGTTIVSHLQIPGDRDNLLPATFNMTCSASNIVGRTTWTIEIRYGKFGYYERNYSNYIYYYKPKI